MRALHETAIREFDAMVDARRRMAEEAQAVARHLERLAAAYLIGDLDAVTRELNAVYPWAVRQVRARTIARALAESAQADDDREN